MCVALTFYTQISIYSMCVVMSDKSNTIFVIKITELFTILSCVCVYQLIAVSLYILLLIKICIEVSKVFKACINLLNVNTSEQMQYTKKFVFINY